MLAVATAYCVADGFFSICPFQAYGKALNSAYLFLVYLLMRRLFASKQQAALFNKLFSLVAVCVMAFAIISFAYYHHGVLSAGFSEIYHFRHLFHPLGYLNNVWAEISLLLLGYCCIARKYSTVLLPAATIMVMLSFSRGAYLAYASYMALYAVFVRLKKERIRLFVLSVASILLTTCFCHKEMLMTVSSASNISQQRSTTLRISRTENALETAAAKPLWGHGPGSYTLATDATCGETFTDMAPNIVSLLAVEGGLAAILLFCGFCVALLWKVWKHREQTRVRILGCLFLALLLKEMAQATLLTTPSACLIALTCLALTVSPKEKNIEQQQVHGTSYTCMLASLTCLLLTVYPQYSNKAKQINDMRQTVELLSEHNINTYNDHQNEIDKTYSDFKNLAKENVYERTLISSQ